MEFNLNLLTTLSREQKIIYFYIFCIIIFIPLNLLTGILVIGVGGIDSETTTIIGKITNIFGAIIGICIIPFASIFTLLCPPFLYNKKFKTILNISLIWIIPHFLLYSILTIYFICEKMLNFFFKI